MERPEVVGPFGPGLPKINPKLVITVVVAVLLILWIVKGGPAYTVAPDEEGVVLTFGKYTATTQPGLHFKLPWPIQTVEKAPVGVVNRIEIGFRSIKSGSSVVYQTFMNDPSLVPVAQMLTGDENVVNCSMAVQYRIKNSLDYLFNFAQGDVRRTLQDVGEAALRQAVGDHPIDDVLTSGKLEVQNEVKGKMQELADLYGMGVSVTQVQLQDVQPPEDVAAAFRDVATAREERDKIINEALAYQSGEIPIAEGQAEKTRQEAEDYKESRIAEAQGDVARFQAIAKQYEASPDVTKARLYLEAMSQLLPKVRLTVVDKDAGVVNLKNLATPPNPPPKKPKTPDMDDDTVEGGQK